MPVCREAKSAEGSWELCQGVPEKGAPLVAQTVKNSPANAGDSGLIPGWGKSPGEGNGNPLQYFAWEIPWTEEPGRL